MAKFKTGHEPRVRKPFSTTGPSMAKQSFKKECDINHLMAKYQKTGLIDHVSRFQGDYSDLTSVPDYHTAMNKVITAQDAFDTLPSSIRKKFSNNPQEFLEFVSNPDNLAEMHELGLTAPDYTPAESIEPSVQTTQPEPPEAT